MLDLPNQRWSVDFVHDQMKSGRRFRVLNVVDDVTRACLAAVADTSISGHRVVCELTRLLAQRGKPDMIFSCNATELPAMSSGRGAVRSAWKGFKSRRAGYVERLASPPFGQCQHVRRTAERDPFPVYDRCTGRDPCQGHGLQPGETILVPWLQTPAAFAAEPDMQWPAAQRPKGTATLPIAPTELIGKTAVRL